MSTMNLEDISSQYFDVLKEIGNIGAGNATTALSQLLNSKVDMMVPQVRLLDFGEVGASMGGEEKVMAGIYLMVEGDITGSIMFLLDEKAAHLLVAKLMGIEGTIEGELDEIQLSALKEIGNIITGAYLNALSMLTNMKIYPSIPDLCIDMAGAILSVPAIEFGAVGDKILLIQTQFTDEVELDGFFVLVPDPESYHKIMASLGMA
ncbi:MAG: chemotaxis protein CheC [Lachnospiraceae bacterium]|jgi:chemotaxis protein CheC|nr:chemotaxis protein CheC [Lachnospiraceae bacterium]